MIARGRKGNEMIVLNLTAEWETADPDDIGDWDTAGRVVISLNGHEVTKIVVRSSDEVFSADDVKETVELATVRWLARLSK